MTESKYCPRIQGFLTPRWLIPPCLVSYWRYSLITTVVIHDPRPSMTRKRPGPEQATDKHMSTSQHYRPSHHQRSKVASKLVATQGHVTRLLSALSPGSTQRLQARKIFPAIMQYVHCLLSGCEASDQKWGSMPWYITQEVKGKAK